MSTLIPKYESPGSSTVNRPFNLKLQESVSVMDFIPIGTNTATTDVSSYIQAAHNYIVSTSNSGTLLFPAGTYKCNSGLIINCGYVSCLGERAVLDFSSIGDVPAITFTGGNLIAGNPWNQADFAFQGFTVSGPGPTTGVGFYLNEKTTGNMSGPAHTMFRDFKIEGFKTGIYFGNHSYLCFFDHFDIWNATTGIWFPINDLAGNAITDAGENITFYNGTIYGTTLYDFYCENTLSYSDFAFFACSFDGSGDAQVYNNSGTITFTGCHFEGSAKRAIYNATTSGIITLINGYMIDNGDKSLSGYIYNTGYMSIYGGRIVSYDRSGIVYSTQRLACIGTHFQTNQATQNQIVATGSSYNYWIPNQGDLNISGAVYSGAVYSGVLGGKQPIYTLSTLNTWVSLGYGTRNGLYLFRDTTSGGVSAYLADSTMGAVAISNNINGFEMNFGGVSGQMSIRVTYGTVPRNISMTFVQVTPG